MKLLPESEYWTMVAEAFEYYHETGFHLFNHKSGNVTQAGLCYCVHTLTPHSGFSHSPMARRIEDYMKSNGPKEDYIWPCRRTYAANRAQLARRFAKEAKEEESKIMVIKPQP